MRAGRYWGGHGRDVGGGHGGRVGGDQSSGVDGDKTRLGGYGRGHAGGDIRVDRRHASDDAAGVGHGGEGGERVGLQSNKRLAKLAEQLAKPILLKKELTYDVSTLLDWANATAAKGTERTAEVRMLVVVCRCFGMQLFARVEPSKMDLSTIKKLGMTGIKRVCWQWNRCLI